MSVTQVDVVVVGAGLSGLCAAWKCAMAGLSVAVLEARDRIGGRLLSDGDAIDLGAAWTWPHGEPAVGRLLGVLGIKSVPQFEDGDTILDTANGVGRHPLGGGQEMRIVGGTARIPQVLLEQGAEHGVQLHLSHAVHAVNMEAGGATVSAKQLDDTIVTYNCKKVVLALPPQLILSRIELSPAFEPSKIAALQQTPIWMSDTMKVVSVFKTPFWRNQGLSGAGQSMIGPIRQLWDNSFEDGNGRSVAALAGFVLGRDCQKLKGKTTEEVSAAVLPQLRRMLGPHVDDQLISIRHQNWLDESWTHVDHKAQGGFGHPRLRTPWHHLHFAGTETERSHGHMEGAVIAGERVAEEIIALLRPARDRSDL